MATAYKFYRLRFLKNSSEDLRYYAFATLSLYETLNGSTEDLARTGVATASGQYQSQSPKLAIDNNDSTYFESANAQSNGPQWFKLELPAAKIVRSIRIVSGNSPGGEHPVDFVLEGSSDGATWQVITNYVNFPQTVGLVVPVWMQVRGVSKLSTGAASNRIYIHNWATGVLLANLTPEPDGAYAWTSFNTDQVSVTHIGPPGYRPVCDGPIEPAEV